MFDGDSQNHRKSILVLKQRALNLSKKIHEDIVKEEEEIKNSKNNKKKIFKTSYRFYRTRKKRRN